VPGSDIKDLTWFKPDGEEIVDQQWADPEARSLGLRLAGEAIDEREAEGGRISDDTLLVLLNAFHEDVVFTLPEAGADETCKWELLMDTEKAEPPHDTGTVCVVGGTYSLAGRALALFKRVGSA
jgi:glycogen operon protein